MNILYLGPYKQLDDSGEISRLYLQTLIINHKITAGCVYTSFDVETIKETFSDLETPQSKYDALIQHLPINQLVITQRFKKNIAIPIMGNELCNSRTCNILNRFDKILVDTPYSKNYLDKILKKSPTLIRPSINIDQINSIKNQTFNLGIHDHMQKFYTISHYENNKDLIHSLITEFIHILKHRDNISLVLFLSGINPSSSQKLELYIKRMYEMASIKTSNINIVIVNIKTDPGSLITAHNSGHVFLNISDTPKQSLNLWYAKILDKKIIDITDLESVLCCTRNDRYSDSMFHIPAPNSISKAIDSIIVGSKGGSANQFNNSKKLDDKVLC
jgi:hypothetical protein